MLVGSGQRACIQAARSLVCGVLWWIKKVVSSLWVPFVALTLLVLWQEGHVVYKKHVFLFLKNPRLEILLLLLRLRPFNGLFSRTIWVIQLQKGKSSLDLNEARDDVVLAWQWHQLQTLCTSLQTDNHTNTLSLHFYRPDALPDAQPTVSKTGYSGRRKSRHTE